MAALYITGVAEGVLFFRRVLESGPMIDGFAKRLILRLTLEHTTWLEPCDNVR